MKTKEAIRILEYDVRLFPHKAETLGACLDIYKLAERIDEIIELLKRGEKYEKIVNEIKYEIDWHRPEREVYDAGNKGDDEYINETLDLIERIIQKYFPKEVKSNANR